MPELPEVETVRRGLAPVMEGASFAQVTLQRADLRFPLPRNFASRLEGVRVDVLNRRGKYLIASLSSGDSLIMHLGMSGRFTIDGSSPDVFALEQSGHEKHDHVIFDMIGHGKARIVYNDPRRFGFMDLVASSSLEECKHFKGMGPEPLSNHFTAQSLTEALGGKSTPIKAALLDQSVVAGLGNIYVCEALHRARISPRRSARTVPGVRSERLHKAIVEVLRDAIEAGGSTLRDFAGVEGDLGYFQHRFDVYDRAEAACRQCDGRIARIVQAGRSTFFCPGCQR